VALRCVYTDLDGTLLGQEASLFRDGEGRFTLLPARALEACHRAGVEVVIKSGRRKAQVMEDARLIGQTAYIYELGAGLVIDGEETILSGELRPEEGRSVHDQIAESGAPALLLERFEIEHHEPWHEGRQVSHLFRGRVDVRDANALLDAEGHGGLRLVDNGGSVYHLVPAGTSKANAVAAHMRAREYMPRECIGVGDSREDLAVAEVVGRFFLVANSGLEGGGNVEVTEAAFGEGFYEAVVRSLAEARTG
jgi:hydroxymethylpyrimidine pyrophosphatase-like HAD family hydrolase